MFSFENMCTLFVSWKTHEKYPLIVAANRDEFYERETTRLDWWEENPEILAGKDLEAGGTWMGINKKGKWGVITNYRKFPPEQSYQSSRGELIKLFLNEDMSTSEFQDFLVKTASNYDGYNLMYGDKDSLCYFTNRDPQLNNSKPLGAGNYGLSNAFLDTPWPKVRDGKQLFEKSVAQDQFDKESYFDLLASEKKYDIRELPKTGLSEDMEILVSSICIKSERYGTRTSTLLKMSSNSVEVEERSHMESDIKHFQFPIQ